MANYDPKGGDFGGGGGGFHIKDGNYKMALVSCEEKISKNDSDMFEWVFKFVAGPAKGKSLYLYTVFDEDTNQKVGKVWEAIGHEFEPGDTEVEFDPDEYEGTEVMGEVITDTYMGQKRSKLQMVHPLNGEEEEEEEETTGKSRRRKGNGRNRVVKVSEDEVKEMTEDELEDLNEKYDLGVDLGKAKTLRRKQSASIAALAEKDLIA
jgi:hypothetical protein